MECKKIKKLNKAPDIDIYQPREDEAKVSKAESSLFKQQTICLNKTDIR